MGEPLCIGSESSSPLEETALLSQPGCAADCL